jgi:FkbH-like protein
MTTVKKCVVWDLDNTLWDGVCLEGNVIVKKEVYDTITELDHRGILHSIASRGEEDIAMKVLKENKLAGFFLVPQINWLSKSQNIIKISKELQISLDVIAFIDDDEFERAQVAFMLPDVLTIESEKIKELPGLSYFSPAGITREAQDRRRFYQDEIDRKKSEQSFTTRKDFLISCAMKLKVRCMKENDIPRVLELMTRTHQLNTTGMILDHERLKELLHESPRGMNFIVAELQDKFGWYGIIGIAMIEEVKPLWRLKHFAVSCRVMGRGVERAFIASMIHTAFTHGFTKVEAEFRDTGRNRMMRALYQMMGFLNIGDSNGSQTMIFKRTLQEVPQIPCWIEVV